MDRQEKTDMVTRVGTIIALLVLTQWLTGYTESFAGSYITDSCVNCILVTTALITGLWSGAAVAVLAPFCAFFLGVGPRPLQVVPAIALGNAVLVVMTLALLQKENLSKVKIAVFTILAAASKFIVLYLAVIQVLIPVMGPALPAKQAEALSALFSWPQLLTALIGTALGLLITKVYRKARKK